MKKDIILAGVGGQGILSIAAAIGTGALLSGLHLKQAEVHGMSQRGGDVQSHLRISSGEIASDLIPEGKADLIISVEPMESLRYLHMLGPDGWVITNSTPHVNIPDYPDIAAIIAEIKKIPNHVILDADAIAKDIDSPKSVNMVVMGASAPHLGMDLNWLLEAINKLFRNKGEDIVRLNLLAFNEGLKAANNYVV